MKKILLVICILSLGITSVYCADVTIEAQKQTIQPEINKGFFTGNVRVQIGDVKVSSPRAELDLEPTSKKPSLATFFDNPYAFQENGNKKHEIKADIIKVSLIKKHLLASGNSQSIMLEDRQPMVTITSYSQEYDTTTKIMKAHKNVIVKYGEAETFSNEATANIDDKGDIKHLELLGNVVMKDKQNVIKGNRFIYEPSREEYQISGNTSSDLTFEDGSKIYIEAKYQQLNKNAKTVVAGGKVKIIYNDYVAIGPKAQLLPDPKTGKPNIVLFSGRSKISQQGNTVEADRIKMIMKPKAFYADGNVKTFISGDSNEDLGLMGK